MKLKKGIAYLLAVICIVALLILVATVMYMGAAN